MAKTDKKNSTEPDKIFRLVETINKKHGEGAALTGDTIIETERMSTGSLLLDDAVGGGWGKGRIHEIFGPESSGKTTLCIETMVVAQKSGDIVAFIDAEHAFDKDYAEALGLDVDKLIISQPDNGEQALDIAVSLVSSGEIALLVIDSVAALTPKAELEGEMGDSQMGLHARLMSKGLRALVGKTSLSNTVVIFTNQLRSKIGIMFGNPEVTTGGNALKFYASIRIDMRASKGDESDGVRTSNKVTCKVSKNKLAPPLKKCEIYIDYGKGINKAREILTVAEYVGLIVKSGSWYSYGDIRLAQGEVNTTKMLEDNPELLAEINQKIRSDRFPHEG